jgi:t-SNARE complex subunit (syntaxin)
MREREEEIRTIHKGMHTVNEIYKDLAGLVDEQQEGVDTIETQMENTKENTATGLKHIEKANESSQSQCVIS